MIRRVISGGQTGVDQAGLRAARATGIETGGVAPMGWLTEDGTQQALLESYGLVECTVPGYPARTEANAHDSDATLWFGSADSSGYTCTANGCHRSGKPIKAVKEGDRPSAIAIWLRSKNVAVLNVAGSRGSKCPDGFIERVERFLASVFAEVNRG